jgi:hypothetical protein
VQPISALCDMNFRSFCAAFAMTAARWPQVAAAQVASPFADLGARVKDGQTLIVTGPQDGEITGTLRSLARDTLLLDVEGSRMSSPNRRYGRFALRATAGETPPLGPGSVWRLP